MTVFDQELHKLFGNNKVFEETRIVGNTCYGMLTDNIRVKINFQTGGVADHYDRLKVTLLNRNEGPIDNMVIRFCDLWGRKQVSNPNFKDGIAPHLWSGYGEVSWYVYQPTKADYRQLTEAVSTYLDVFREPVQEPQMGQKMC